MAPRLVLGTVLVLWPAAASAHAFGQRYDLPIPLHFFLIGAGLVLLYTFFSVGLTIDKSSPPKERPIGRLPGWLEVPLAALAGFLFLLTLLTAVLGSTDPAQNWVSTFFWVNVWIGLPILSLLLGNVWERLNPFMVLARWWQERAKVRPYPSRLGYYPALAGLAAFTWLELVFPEGFYPRSLAIALIIYTAFQLAGLVTYGANWVRQAELSAVMARVIGGISAIGWKNRAISLRLPGTGLLSMDTAPGLLAFVTFFISGVTYDGIRETKLWAKLFTSDLPFSKVIQGTIEQLGLFLVILAVYGLFVWGVKQVSGSDRPLNELGRRFAVSLVPVAAAYLVAHYLSYFINTGQDIIRLASDPFGSGWNLFGTRDFKPDIGLVPLKSIWYVQVAVVVTGHAIGLYVAHRVALELFADRTKAFRSQFPMLLLMIALTSLALWILYAPLTG